MIRYFFASNHYRTPINFSYEILEQSKNALERLNDFVISLKDSKNKDNLSLIEKTKNKFLKAMDDDFNTPQAFAVIFDFMKEINKERGGKKSYSLMLDIDKIFNLLTIKKSPISEKVKLLIEKREKARKEKNYQEADKIRGEIRKLGYQIEDSEQSIKIKKL